MFFYGMMLKLIGRVCAYGLVTRSTSPNMATVLCAWSYGRFIEIVVAGSFSNGDNVRALIQFRRESQLQHLKR